MALLISDNPAGFSQRKGLNHRDAPIDRGGHALECAAHNGWPNADAHEMPRGNARSGHATTLPAPA